MAGYKLTTFDGVALPEYDGEPDLSPAEATPTLMRSIGGVFDTWGSTRRLPDMHTVGFTGTYLGETDFVIDEVGGYNINESGDFWIAGTGANRLRAQVDALLEKQGVRGLLVRQRLDDSVNQTKRARLVAVDWKPRTDERTVLAVVSPRFEVAQGAWKNETVTTSTKALAVAWVGLNVVNGGMQAVHDAVITITATNAISDIKIQRGGTIDLRFTGTIAAGKKLIINCGAQTVLNDSVNAYSSFSVGSKHTVEGWLPLARGTNALMISSNAIGSISITHYDQWL
jgi:hypothetical protein